MKLHKIFFLLLFSGFSFSCGKTIYTSVYSYPEVHPSNWEVITAGIRPPYLSPGDSVVLIATSNYVNPKKWPKTKHFWKVGD